MVFYSIPTTTIVWGFSRPSVKLLNTDLNMPEAVFIHFLMKWVNEARNKTRLDSFLFHILFYSNSWSITFAYDRPRLRSQQTAQLLHGTIVYITLMFVFPTLAKPDVAWCCIRRPGLHFRSKLNLSTLACFEILYKAYSG